MWKNAGGYGCGGMMMSMQGKGPFTLTQWAELEQQALIYKYITANVPVPSSLLISIQKSFFPYGSLPPSSCKLPFFVLAYIVSLIIIMIPRFVANACCVSSCFFLKEFEVQSPFIAFIALKSPSILSNKENLTFSWFWFGWEGKLIPIVFLNILAELV